MGDPAAAGGPPFPGGALYTAISEEKGISPRQPPGSATQQSQSHMG